MALPVCRTLHMSGRLSSDERLVTRLSAAITISWAVRITAREVAAAAPAPIIRAKRMRPGRYIRPAKSSTARYEQAGRGAPEFYSCRKAFVGYWSALLRIVLHVEVAREPFSSRAALQAYRFLVGHAPAQRDQEVVCFVLR